LVGLVDVHPRAWTAVISLIACVYATVFYVAGALSRSDAAGLPLWVGTLTGAVALAWVLAVRHGGALRHLERASLTATARRDLDVAFDRECQSRARYRAAVGRWPEDATLDELLAVSERRVEQLGALFSRDQRDPPKALDDATVVPPPSLAEAYRTAARDEAEKIAMYDRFLLSIDESRVREMFRRLRWESNDDCLERLRAVAPREDRASADRTEP